MDGAGGWRRVIGVLGFAALAAAWLPSLLAGVVAVADGNGEHELRCRATAGGFELTLHHIGNFREHHHNLLERLVIGDADEDEPDHHLAFALSDGFSEMPDEELPPAMAELLRETVMPLPGAHFPAGGRSAASEICWRSPPPLWRGVVMTI